jgi:hypothetical protein
MEEWAKPKVVFAALAAIAVLWAILNPERVALLIQNFLNATVGTVVNVLMAGGGLVLFLLIVIVILYRMTFGGRRQRN